MRGRKKDCSEPSEGMDAEASLHGCIHGVFRTVLLPDSPLMQSWYHVPVITDVSMTALEKRTVTALAGLYSFRMLGLFMVLPLLTLYGADLAGGNNVFLLGLALGAYGLAQALLQIPLGLLSDRVGRVPVILGGLLVFAGGSLLAAQADTIEGVILGRFLQGAGAIASTVMALVADLTSDRQRTKAMAVVGMSIGLSFGLALVLGPILAAWGGLAAVFNATALLALAGILVVLFAVPKARQARAIRGETGTVPKLLARSLRDASLMRLNIGIFVLHFVLMAVFVSVPGVLEQQLGLDRADHWKLYLPVLALSLAGVVALFVLAERKGRLRGAFLLAVLAVALAQGPLNGLGGHWLVYPALWVFFVGFNYLEASLPSLVSKTAYAGGRGTALGVYSSFQFLGVFAGGAAGGWVFQHWGSAGIALCSSLLAALWWLSCLNMKAPRHLASLTVRLPDRAGDWVESLGSAPGVADLMVLEGENTAYLKVDEALFDPSILPDDNSSAASRHNGRK